ncbi:type II secretion system minor pseudopilin GspI [Algicola sagamiensis]|uniref:type II secretion system minor pseudopilin GspI n=1 Tax=Algicola sagamiensis TaxID=163869 RepID=UPI0003763331|nr:type II secretion system minor pseudopilin GspI [Algicola sagamiensis]
MKRVVGFTLLEMMVAISIFAFAGIAVMKVANEHLHAMSLIEKKTLASWVASNRLVEIRLEKKWPISNKRGDTELADLKWYWYQQKEKVEHKGIVKVTVKVFEDEANEHEIYRLTTYFSNPK